MAATARSSCAGITLKRAVSSQRAEQNGTENVEHTTETRRPSALLLSTYGSQLGKPVIGWALAAALLALIFFSLTQLVPFFRSSNPQYGRVRLTALAVTGEIFTTRCNLAKRKFRLHLHERPVDDDPVVQAWRQDLQQLR